MKRLLTLLPVEVPRGKNGLVRLNYPDFPSLEQHLDPPPLGNLLTMFLLLQCSSSVHALATGT